MALDGIVIANIVYDLKENILNGRIDKISQPEKDELILGIRSFKSSFKLLLTASASSPRLHFTDKSKQNPLSAPLFCMVLRKHINNGKIIDITQPDFERIIVISIESLNELGDLSVKKLIIEIMGKHSNIILTDPNDVILDSIKRISHDKSSVREVLPGKIYTAPPSQGKLDPLLPTREQFKALLSEKNMPIHSAIYKSFNGISPVMASEVCFRTGVDAKTIATSCDKLDAVACEFESIMSDVKNNSFTCEAYCDEYQKVIEFTSIPMRQFQANNKITFPDPGRMLEAFYGERDLSYRISQKTQDLRKIVTQNIERCAKKADNQQATLKEIEDREYLRLCGELLTANIYSVVKGMTSIELQNFYDESGGTIAIPLDATLTPSENAQKYFKKYNKHKRTFLALQEQIVQNQKELAYLETVLNSLFASADEADIEEIREELSESGYVKKKRASKQKPRKSKPLCYKSSDGFLIYVGKNNKQNDELTLKLAKNDDIWMHTKEIPGSHVIIKADGKNIPDSTLTEGAHLAAYYSKAKDSAQVPVDYTYKKNVKKPSGAKPGMVIYERNKTAYVTPNDDFIKKLSDGYLTTH